MKLESDGILIGLRPFGERDLIAKVFTRDYGILTGMLRGGAVARKNRVSVGQVGHVAWVARLDSQLGQFHWDTDANLALAFLSDKNALLLFNSGCALMDSLLPEREAYSDLYNATLNCFCNLNPDSYLQWEIVLLRELGYAVDLSHCSGCGGHDNLNYLSPRTCRAVCDDCAKPYMDKLYKLPITLNTTFRLLENICVQQGVNLPKMRSLIREINF